MNPIYASGSQRHVVDGEDRQEHGDDMGSRGAAAGVAEPMDPIHASAS